MNTKKRAPRFIDRTGHTYGRLTVVELSHIGTSPNGTRQSWWLCKCSCGNETTVRGGSLNAGVSNSCGCFRREHSRKQATTHGMSQTSEFKIWTWMNQRCFNPKATKFYLWGGRGITVCDRWRNSFANFIADMGRRPSKDHSIERKDTNGNYDPSNCVWATRKEQGRNRRNNQIVVIRGITKHLRGGR